VSLQYRLQPRVREGDGREEADDHRPRHDPRTTLAQAMDVRSSQANLAGYWPSSPPRRSAQDLPNVDDRAGQSRRSRVLIMGRRRLASQGWHRQAPGPIVEATDVGPETKEQSSRRRQVASWSQGLNTSRGPAATGRAVRRIQEGPAAMVSAAISKRMS